MGRRYVPWALLGLEPVWLCSRTGATCSPPPSHRPRRRKLCAGIPMRRRCMSPRPTTFGKLTDIAGLAGVCHRYGVPLLVDNAHGAELQFTPEGKSPHASGADLCCDSLHKTLPVLTGGAMLHVGDTPLTRQHGFVRNAKDAMPVRLHQPELSGDALDGHPAPRPV